MLTKIKPFNHRLFVQAFRPPEETVTEGGIILHQRGAERELETGIRAHILAVGHHVDPELQVGDWILIPAYTGTRMSTNDHLIIGEDCIIGKLDPTEVTRELGLDRHPKRASGIGRARLKG